MAKHRNLSFRPACESKESREGGGPEVVVGETVVNVEAGAGVVGDSYHQGVYHFWNINFIR